VLLQTTNDIVGNSVTFFFCQFLTKTAHKFARPAQCECDGEAQHVPAREAPMRDEARRIAANIAELPELLGK
jgi:hypothetical protein